jgi:hypothetical protein
MGLFFIAHAIGEVYIYNWDPLALLDPKAWTSLFGSYLFLYGALGLIIVILFFMKLPIISRVMTIGILVSQVFFFLQRWDNYIYNESLIDPFPLFYKRILLSIILGFVLQVMWRLITKWSKYFYYKLTISNSKGNAKTKKA